MDQFLIDMLKRLHDDGSLLKIVAEKILNKSDLKEACELIYERANVNPPDEWIEINSPIPILRKWALIDTDIIVQASCETYSDGKWLRLSTSKGKIALNNEEINFIIKDFLGEQWIEPNKRTFIIPLLTEIFHCLYITFCFVYRAHLMKMDLWSL